MIITKNAKQELQSEKTLNLFKTLYQDTNHPTQRYLRLLEGYTNNFGEPEKIGMYSAPGRSEIGGNHTDHQNGCVVTASVQKDVAGIAGYSNTDTVTLISEGYGTFSVDLNNLEVNKEEYNTIPALIRGICAKYIQLGYKIAGFNAYISSDVLAGSGISSSASFEVWLGIAINNLFCKDEIIPEEIAKIGQYSENIYFGKPSGLQDQMASSVGGIVFIDFKDTASPVICKLPSDLGAYTLCIIDSGGDHSDLTPEYAAIPYDMEKISGYFKKSKMREVQPSDFYKEFSKLKDKFPHRALLRAYHFTEENQRAIHEKEMLINGNIQGFLHLVNQSGRSSYMYLQNIFPSGAVEHQNVALALCVCEKLLNGKGACRVHGGGFAGTVQAFVPTQEVEAFKKGCEAMLTQGCCHIMNIRSVGGCVIL